MLRSAFIMVGMIALMGLLPSTAVFANPGETLILYHPQLNADQLSGLSGLPFIGILLSIALLPLLTPNFWHQHKGWVALFWATATILPLTMSQGANVALPALFATCVFEYLPFVILLLTLFTLSSGIVVRIPGHATPGKNTFLFLMATLSANFIGTTGAAMLFIRPLLHLNAERKAKMHVVIFFIILVGNLGGCLSPLGDPPLFLGFLKGVPFFWPTVYLFLPFILVTGPVLLLFYIVDAYCFAKGGMTNLPLKKASPSSAWAVQGALNIVLLGAAIGVILFSGLVNLQKSITLLHFSFPVINLLRDGLLLIITGLSWRYTPGSIRELNLFSWEPIKEVGILFFAIFITAMPLTALLQAGEKGSLAPLFGLIQEQGQPLNHMYFWLTGALSAFLDNAPTYLVFFSLAGGDPTLLTSSLARTLTAISCGAVFMGALTYIGNAPNFMVKAIAEMHHIRMPTFFVYFVYASIILLPLFLLLTWIMFF